MSRGSTIPPARPRWRSSALLLAVTLAVGFITAFPLLREKWLENRHERRFGPIIHETRSDYSHIRVRERGRTRSLIFVEKGAVEQRQSAIDLTHPEQLELAYNNTFFASFLFKHPQKRVLIVGLGGGGMVRFLNHHFPDTQVEAVEIDPAVIRVAAEYFETRPSARTTIHQADAFVFLEKDHGPYDAIYMDAFLKPAPDSGLETLTNRLKTIDFLAGLHRQIHPDGVVAFNLIKGASTDGDLQAIRTAFPAVYVFHVPKTLNLVAIATRSEETVSLGELEARAESLDESLTLDLDFREILRQWRP